MSRRAPREGQPIGASLPTPTKPPNFTIGIDVDGRREPVTVAPRRADGGFTMTILMRDDGDEIVAARIIGESHAGVLSMTIMTGVEPEAVRVVTER